MTPFQVRPCFIPIMLLIIFILFLTQNYHSPLIFPLPPPLHPFPPHPPLFTSPFAPMLLPQTTPPRRSAAALARLQLLPTQTIPSLAAAVVASSVEHPSIPVPSVLLGSSWTHSLFPLAYDTIHRHDDIYLVHSPLTYSRPLISFLPRSCSPRLTSSSCPLRMNVHTTLALRDNRAFLPFALSFLFWSRSVICSGDDLPWFPFNCTLFIALHLHTRLTQVKRKHSAPQSMTYHNIGLTHLNGHRCSHSTTFSGGNTCIIVRTIYGYGYGYTYSRRSRVYGTLGSAKKIRYYNGSTP